MKQTHHKSILTGSILIIATALFLVVNIAAGTFFKSWRIDLTRSKLYTLSAGSKEILKEIQEPIVLRLYFSRSLSSINPYLLSFATRVEDLLRQYQRASRGKLVVEVIDPEPFSPQEDEAVNYGLQGVPIDNTGTEFYLGLVGTDALNSRHTIPFLQPSREANLEYDLSQLIFKLVHPQPRVVGLMSSLPIDGGPNVRPWAIWQQMQQLFEVRVLDTNAEEIPEQVNTLMVVEPSTFSQGALKAIDAFVMRGGHVLAFVDPVAEVSDPRMAYMQKINQKDPGNYLELLKAWGIDFDDSKAVADKDLAKAVRAPYEGREVTVRFPLWMDFEQDNFAQGDVLSASLERLTLATPGSLQKSADATTNFTPLITTSDQAMLVDGTRVNEYQQNLQLLLNEYKPQNKFTVAARISGPIKSPYGDSKVDNSSIIVIADTDMLHDHFWMNVQSIMGQDFAVPSASNGNLVLSALDNLSGSNALISIRNRGSFAKPFETIRALELQSQEKYRETESMLQAKLQLTKQKLEALEAQKKDSNHSQVFAQQRKEEETFRQELVDVRRDLRDVRRKLNHDIESVARNIKLFSIGLVPLLIVGMGLLVWGLQIQREIKSRRAACSTPKP